MVRSICKDHRRALEARLRAVPLRPRQGRLQAGRPAQARRLRVDCRDPACDSAVLRLRRLGARAVLGALSCAREVLRPAGALRPGGGSPRQGDRLRVRPGDVARGQGERRGSTSPTWFAGVGYHLGIFAGARGPAVLLAGRRSARRSVLRRSRSAQFAGGRSVERSPGASVPLRRTCARLSCPGRLPFQPADHGLRWPWPCARTSSPVALEPVFLAETACCSSSGCRWARSGTASSSSRPAITWRAHFGRRGTFPPGPARARARERATPCLNRRTRIAARRSSTPADFERGLAVFREKLREAEASYLQTCVHCGLCADSCHYYRTDRELESIPAHKLDQVVSVFKRHFTIEGRLVPGPAWAPGPSTGPWPRKWVEAVFGRCSLCGRCSLNCTTGIHIATILRAARSALAEMGLVPSDLQAIVTTSLESGNNMGITQGGLARHRGVDRGGAADGGGRSRRRASPWTRRAPASSSP